MVRLSLEGRDIRDRAVLNAFRRVPREMFVPEDVRPFAYEDRPLAIGHGQTISQPYMIAYMLQLLELKPGDRVLEIGVGSGYQTALLSYLCMETTGVEIRKPLLDRARENLERAGPLPGQVDLRLGDGYDGVPGKAPFNAIILSCAAERIPPPLLEQLAPGGRLTAPVGGKPVQTVRLARKGGLSVAVSNHAAALFVPMVGKALNKSKRNSAPL